MIIQGGPDRYGIPIGVLCLESFYPKLPGHIKNATTFDFPIAYKTIKGTTGFKLISNPDGMIGPFIQAAKELEQEGVKAITGSCGFLALFQEEIADAVSIPVFTSSMMQIPMIHTMLGSKQRVGLVVANKAGLTDAHLKAVGANNIPLCIAGMEHLPEFREVIHEQKRKELDTDKLQQEIVSVAESLVAENENIGAIVLECTDMPPYSLAIQQRLNLPVFDLITLIKWVHSAVVQKQFTGYEPR